MSVEAPPRRAPLLDGLEFQAGLRRWKLARATMLTTVGLCVACVIGTTLLHLYGEAILALLTMGVYGYWYRVLEAPPRLSSRVKLYLSVLGVISFLSAWCGPHSLCHFAFPGALPLAVGLFPTKERAWQLRLSILTVLCILVFETNRWMEWYPGHLDRTAQEHISLLALLVLVVTTLSRLRFLSETNHANEEMLNHAHEAAIEKQEQLEDAQALAKLGTFTLDLKTQTLAWSREMYEIHGLPQDERPPTDLATVFADDRPTIEAAVRALTQTQRPQSIAWRITRPDGEIRYLQGVIAYTFNVAQEPIRLVGTLQDITAQQVQLHELARAREEALEASRAKSDFLAHMSHEIRTPLSGVLGMLGLTMETRLEPEQAEYLEAARTSADHLLTILNDILDLSKIEAGKMELEDIPFSVRGVAREAARAMAGRAQEKGLELLLEVDARTPMVVRGDPVRVRQILLNLLGNAIKFTTRGEVTLKVSPGPGGWIYVAVEDTGIGIPQDRLHGIFDAFSQADSSTTRKFGGTGLGLTICRELARRMGGDLEVESVLGKGSTFRAKLDLLFVEEPLPAPQPLCHQPVLLCEEHPRLRAALIGMLEALGAEVSACASLAEARRRLDVSETRFALAIFDSRSTAEDDNALVGGLSQHPALAGARRLLLTTAMQRPSRERLAQSGFEKALLKPVALEDLLEACVGAGEQGGRAHAARAPSRSLRILLAEDNPINAKVAIKLLEKQGHSVIHAVDGAKALAAAQQLPVDLVLMDMQMPEMDGLEATRQIRAWEAATSRLPLPILALTANAMKGDADRCMDAGMNGYLSKPIQPDALAMAVEELMQAQASAVA